MSRAFVEALELEGGTKGWEVTGGPDAIAETPGIKGLGWSPFTIKKTDLASQQKSAAEKKLRNLSLKGFPPEFSDRSRIKAGAICDYTYRVQSTE